MRVRCLGDELTEYAAGRLPLDRQWAWDRHLVACQVCCHAVAQERRLRSALAGSPSMPGELRSSLLALGTSMAAEAPPRAAAVAHPDPLRLLAPSAPGAVRPALATTSTPVVSPAAAPSRTTSASSTVSPVGLSQTVVLTPAGQRAQSTP